MSDWLSPLDSDEQQQLDAFRVNKAQLPAKKPEAGLFDGALGAIPAGIGAGLTKTATALAKPLGQVVDTVAFSLDNPVDSSKPYDPAAYPEYLDQSREVRNSALVQTVESLADSGERGKVGQVLFGLSDYGTRALLGAPLGGVGAAATLGVTEGAFNYTELTEKGVDSGTAAKVAAIDSVVAGGSALLPISFGLKGGLGKGLLADFGLSVGAATGIGVAGQAASGAVLESAGYDKQAKQYEVTAESVATDAVLNSIFFGAAKGVSWYQNKNTPPQAADVDPEIRAEAQDAVLAVNEASFDEAAAPVKPKNMAENNKHLLNLDEAVDALKTGQQVKPRYEVKGDAKAQPKPQLNAKNLPQNAQLIAAQAQQAGIDPRIALTISHMETGGTFSSSAQNPKSSANGVFQVTKDSWKGLGGGDRADVGEQVRIGLKHISEATKVMEQSLGRKVQGYEFYMGHLLGPSTAAKVLKADPARPMIDVVREISPKSAEAIVKNNGMDGLTVEQALAKWQGKWNATANRYGNDNASVAYGMDGSSFAVNSEVRSLNDLIASNDLAYNVNPNYPSELQPRDRTRVASRQQIEQMANDLKPDLLGESAKISDGAPIIGADGVVESGNGRTLAIAKAYESGKADAYRQYVEDWAAQRGMDISGIENPVLVRTRLTDVDRAEFARLANESDVAQFSPSEMARSDADRLPDASLLQTNADGTLNIEGSMDYVRGFVASLPQSERAQVMTEDGRLSQGGKRRIENAMMQRAYKQPDIVKRLSENLDDDSKNVLSAMLKAAPQLTQLDDLVAQGGRAANTIAADVAQAAQKLSDIKASGQSVQDYLNQGQLVDDGLSDGARQFLQAFDQSKRSAKGIAEAIQQRIDEVNALGDPRQGSLFGDDADGLAAAQIAQVAPNMPTPFESGRIDENGNAVPMTVSEYVAQLEQEAAQVELDKKATQAAITCALQFGE